MTKLKIKDASGNCCCGGGTCAIFCSSRGGTATLCGFPEFLIPSSSPPKKYRKMTPSGQAYFCYHSGSDTSCTGPVGVLDSYDFDAADVIEYNAANCVQSPSSPHYTHYIQSGTALSCGYSASGDTHVESEGIGDQGPSSSIGINTTTNRTLTTWEQTGFGSSNCIFSPGGYYNFFGNSKQTLSTEDTETDAIARIPGIDTWSDYLSCSGDLLCCRTAWQIRGAGQFSFEYIESRIKVQGATSSPSQHVSVKVELWRRTYGVGSYVLYQTLEDDVTSGLDSFFSIDFGVVNNTKGFETVCRNCSVTLV